MNNSKKANILDAPVHKYARRAIYKKIAAYGLMWDELNTLEYKDPRLLDIYVAGTSCGVLTSLTQKEYCSALGIKPNKIQQAFKFRR